MALPWDVSLLAFAFTAGAFTFFAPCAYPLLPGYVSYYLGRSTEPAGGWTSNGRPPVTGRTAVCTDAAAPGILTRSPLATRVARAAAVSAIVSAGFFLVYGVLAGVVASLGTQVLAGISLLELVVGLLLVVLGGLMALDWTPPTASIRLPERRRTPWGYFGFGVLYAAAAAGCTAPVFVGVALQALAVGPWLGLATFGAYAAGMSVLMLGVTVGTALGRDALLDRLTRRIDLVHRAAGGLLVVAGVVQIYLFLFRFGGFELLGL